MGLCGLGVLLLVGSEVAVVCYNLVLLCDMYSSGLLAGGQKIQDSTGPDWFYDITYNVCRYEFPYKEFT